MLRAGQVPGLMVRRLVVVGLLFCTTYAESQVYIENPTAAGLTIVVRPGQWSTSDGSPRDQRCVAGETEVGDAAGERLCVIGTHGGIGEIQCMPPAGVFGASGAQELVCSVCYAGTPTTISGEQGVAQGVAQLQGVPCDDVIACTGPVVPHGNVPAGNGGRLCDHAMSWHLGKRLHPTCGNYASCSGRLLHNWAAALVSDSRPRHSRMFCGGSAVGYLAAMP
jgi:hypothetical protein